MNNLLEGEGPHKCPKCRKRNLMRTTQVGVVATWTRRTYQCDACKRYHFEIRDVYRSEGGETLIERVC